MRMSRTVAATAAASMLFVGLGVVSAAADPAALDRAPSRTFDINSIDWSWGIDLGPDGSAYVTYDVDYIEVYAPDASGSGGPARVIEGAATGLDRAIAVDIDDSGLVYALNTGPGANTGSITVYAAGAGGNAAPLRTIKGAATKLDFPRAISIGPDGDLYVASYTSGGTSGRITVYPRTANGNVAPKRTVGGALTQLWSAEDIAFDSDGDMYVSDYYGSILVYPRIANGNVAPKRVIDGVATGMGVNGQLAVDTSGNVYVADYASHHILVFAKGAGGNVEPSTVLGGPATGLNGPWGLDLDADRNLYVANYDGRTVTKYEPLVPFTKPSAATGVTVAGKAKAKARTISWKKSTDDGGAQVTYRVVVTNGSRTTLDKKTTATSLSVGRKNLRSGKHTVTVTASNRAGTASSASASFTVAKIKPAKVTKVKVKGKKSAAERTVRWKRPAWDGGSKITGYRVVVKKGKATLVDRMVKAKKRIVKIARSELGSGKHKVLVRAKNAKGLGAAGKAGFKVKQ
jgi:hypothetical protein